MGEENILSASRIKTFESCSWKYWCTYSLKLPRSSNDGASRGTVCHLILELLLADRHKKYIDIILESGTIESVPPIVRLVKKHLNILGYYSDENYQMCDEMIVVGLSCDFLGGKGAKIEEPEKEFTLESESPKYKILGFIDKPVQYPKSKKLKIVDYKTSREKFTDSEVEYNVQALAYILASKQIWPKLKNVSVEFQFLRFPDSPSIEIKCSEEELKGFEYYLEHIYNIINNYTEEIAKSNFAARQPFPEKGAGFKGPLNCGFAKYPGELKKNGLPMWHCEHKFAYDYYALVDEEGKTLKSSKNKEDLDETKGEIVKKHYAGCPAHQQPESLFDDDDDDFNF